MENNYRYQPFFTTRYYGPTNNRGSRVRATNATTGKSVTVPWEPELNAAQNAVRAVRAVFEKYADADEREAKKNAEFLVCGVGGDDYIATFLPEAVK